MDGLGKEHMAGNVLYLPDGLTLEQIEPTWLTSLWPMTNLDSSLGSIIMTLGIYVLIFFVAVFMAFVAKATFHRYFKKLGSLAFIVLGLGSLASGALAFTMWNAEDSISNKEMGVQVAKVSQWMGSQGVSADNRQTWDLVCHFYDHKNENCDDNNVPVVMYKGQKKEVHLEKNNDGSIYLYVFADRVPLVD